MFPLLAIDPQPPCRDVDTVDTSYVRITYLCGLYYLCGVLCYFFNEHNHTPSGKKMVTGVQVVTAYQVQFIGCRWQAISSHP